MIPLFLLLVMAKITFPNPSDAQNLETGGDNIYLQAGSIVVRVNPTPPTPTTIAKQDSRQLLKTIAKAWKALTPSQKNTWTAYLAFFPDRKSRYHLFVKNNMQLLTPKIPGTTFLTTITVPPQIPNTPSLLTIYYGAPPTPLCVIWTNTYTLETYLQAFIWTPPGRARATSQPWFYHQYALSTTDTMPLAANYTPLNRPIQVHVRALNPRGEVSPEVVQFAVQPPHMWFGGTGDYKIHRAYLDGSQEERLVPTATTQTTHIALDLQANKMYWTRSQSPKIRRANLNGTDSQDITPSGTDYPLALALDLTAQKLYYVDWGTDKIRRANLDGSNVQDLVTSGLSNPIGIALHVPQGKMYWTDYGTNKIQRANLDGSNVEDLVTSGLHYVTDLDLDPSLTYLYWPDLNAKTISRAYLDGSNVQQVIYSTYSNPTSIAARGQ